MRIVQTFWTAGRDSLTHGFGWTHPEYMINRWFFICIFIFSAAVSKSQESIALSEGGNHIGSQLTTPMKSPYKLLEKVIKRIHLDRDLPHEVASFIVEARISKDNLEPITASCIFTGKVGIGLHGLFLSKMDDFRYEGSNQLSRNDSIHIVSYLKLFGGLSPTPALTNYGSYGGVISPLQKYSITSKWYNTKAELITDASGRESYRMHFVRNSIRRPALDGSTKNDPRHIAGTATFDNRTLQLTSFKGQAHLITTAGEPALNYTVSYEEDTDTPVMKQMNITWEKNGTLIKVTVQRYKK